MKKVVYLIGIVALMASCSGNTTSNEPAPTEGTEMQLEVPAVVDSVAVPVDSVGVVAQ